MNCILKAIGYKKVQRHIYKSMELAVMEQK
jgi:hypothetical protein